MDNVRLKQSHRDAIKKELLEQKFSGRKAAVVKRRADLARSIYDRRYSEEDRRKMSRLPDGWLPKASTIRAKLGSIEFSNELPRGASLPIPSSDRSYDNVSNYLFALDGSDPMSKEAASIRDEEAAMASERDKLAREIMSVVYSVSTANKLVTAWPEIARVVSRVCKVDAVNANLPVVKVQELNAALGLKSVAA